MRNEGRRCLFFSLTRCGNREVLRQFTDVISAVQLISGIRHLIADYSEYGSAELPHLLAGIIHVVLPCHSPPCRLQDIGEGIAEKSSAAMGECEGACRVRGDELDLDLAPFLSLRANRRRVLRGDIPHPRLEPLSRKGKVNETGCCDSYRVRHTAKGPIGGQPSRQLLGDCHRRQFFSRSESQRDIGRVIAIHGILRLFYRDRKILRQTARRVARGPRPPPHCSGKKRFWSDEKCHRDSPSA